MRIVTLTWMVNIIMALMDSLSNVLVYKLNHAILSTGSMIILKHLYMLAVSLLEEMSACHCVPHISLQRVA